MLLGKRELVSVEQIAAEKEYRLCDATLAERNGVSHIDQRDSVCGAFGFEQQPCLLQIKTAPVRFQRAEDGDIGTESVLDRAHVVLYRALIDFDPARPQVTPGAYAARMRRFADQALCSNSFPTCLLSIRSRCRNASSSSRVLPFARHVSASRWNFARTSPGVRASDGWPLAKVRAASTTRPFGNVQRTVAWSRPSSPS